MRMRIVADTNVLISALGWKGSNPYKIIEKCFKGEITLVTSSDIISEFKDVATRPKFEFSLEEIDEFVSALIEISDVVQPRESFNIIEGDPDDNKFIDAAVSGKAACIVSGDSHLLNLRTFRGIRILKPADFVRMLK